SKTTATRIPEGFHFGAPCSPIALREQRVPGAASGAEATDRMPPVTPIRYVREHAPERRPPPSRLTVSCAATPPLSRSSGPSSRQSYAPPPIYSSLHLPSGP